MPNKKFNIDFDASMNISKVKIAVGEIQKSLSGVSMPQNISTRFARTFEKLNQEIANFEQQAAKGLNEIGDFKNITRAGQNILKCYQDIQAAVRQLGNLSDKELAKLFPADISAKIEKANKAMQEYSDTIKKTETQIKSQTSKINTQTKKVKELEQQLEDLKQKKDVVSDIDFRTFAKEISSAQKALDNLNKKMEEDNGEFKKAKALLEAKQIELPKTYKLSPYWRKAYKTVEQYNQELEKSKNKIEELQIAQNKRTKQSDYTSSLEKQNTKIESAKKELTELQEVLDNIKAKSPEAFSKLVEEFGKIEGIDVTKLQTFDDVSQALSSLNTNALEQIRENMSGVVQSTKNAGPTFSNLANNIDTAEVSLKQFNARTQEIEGLKQQITYFFGLSNSIELFKRAVRSAYETVKELDEVMTQTAVVTDFTVGDMWSQLPEYTKRANELGVAVKGAYESATLYYQQGLDTNEVVAVSTETLKMARIAGMDYADATNYMTAALRGFNMEINETNAQRINDVYSKLAAITASDTQEIATAMTKTASIASNAGMEFETTAAFLSQIIETTREAPETAGTALKTVIARFQELKKDPSLIGEVDGEVVDANKIETALRTIDVELRDTNGQFRDLDSVFLEIAQKWKTLDTNSQRYIATMAAGSRQQSRFIAMMSDYTRTMELVNAANNSAGASQQQFEKTLDSLESKLAKLDNAWNEFTMGLANSVVIKGAVDLITLLINAINNLTDILPAGIDSFAKLGIVWGTLRGAGKVFDSTLLNMKQNMGPVEAISKSLSSNFKELSKVLTKNFWVGLTPELSGENYNKLIESIKKAQEAEEHLNLARNSTIVEAYNTDEAQKALTEANLIREQALKNLGLTQQSYNEIEALGLSQSQKAILYSDLESAAKIRNKIATEKLTKEEIEQLIAEEAINREKQTGVLIRAKEAVTTKLEILAKKLNIATTNEEAIANSKLVGWITKVTGAKKGLAIAGGLAAAKIAALAAVLFILGKAIYNALPEQQLKKATAAANEAADAAENLKNKYDELKTSLDSISEKETNLENLTKGTTEWKEAVQELNNELINLATNYPELSRFITSENGVLTLDVEGAEEVLRQIEQNKNLAQNAANSARIIQNQKQARVDFETLGLNAQLYTIDANGVPVSNYSETSNLAKRIASGELAPQDIQAEVNRLGFANVIDEEVIKELQQFGNSLLAAENQAKVFTSQLVNTGLEFNNIPAEVVSGGEEYLRIAAEGLLDKAKTEVGSIDNTERKEYAKMMGYTTGGLFGNKFFDAKGNEVENITNEVIKAALANKKVIEDKAFKTSAQVIQKAISGSYGNTASHLVTDGSGALTGGDLGTAQTWDKFVANNGLADFIKEVGTEIAAEMEKNFYNLKEEYDKIFKGEDGSRNLGDFGFTQGEDFQDVGVTTLKGFLDNLQIAMMGSGVEGATQLGQAIKEEYAKLSPELGEQFLAAINALDWKNIDSIEGFNEVLNELGIDVEGAGIDVEALEDKIKEAAKATRELSFENLKDELKGLEDLADDIKDRESTAREFTEEQMNSLIKAGANRDDFIMSGIDEYTYIGDSLISLLESIEGYTSSILQEIIGNTQDKIARGEIYAAAAETSYGRNVSTADGTVYKGLSNLDILEYLINGRLNADSFTNKDLQELARVFMPDFNFDSFGNKEIVNKLKEDYDEVYGLGGTILNQNNARYNDEKQKELELSYSKLGSGQAILDKEALSPEELKAQEKALDSLILKGEGLKGVEEEITKGLKEQNSSLKANSKLIKAHVIDLDSQYKAANQLLSVLNEENLDILKKGQTNEEIKGAPVYQAALEEIVAKAQKVWGDKINSSFVEDNFLKFVGLSKGGEEAVAAFGEIGRLISQQWKTELLEVLGTTEDITTKITEIIESTNPNLKIGGTFDASAIFEQFGNTAKAAAALQGYLNSIGYETTINGFSVISSSSGRTLVSNLTKDNPDYDYYIKAAEEGRVKLLPKALGTKINPKAFNYHPTKTKKSSTSEWKNPYDKQYNTIEKINEELRKREILEKNFQRLQDQDKSTALLTLEYYNKLYKNLERQLSLQEKLKLGRKKELQDLYNKNPNFRKYGEYKEGEGLITISHEQLNKIKKTDTKTGEAVENYISELERITGSIEDIDGEILDIKQQQQDIKKELTDAFLSFEERVANAMEAAAQKDIDAMQKEFDALTDAESKLTDAISKSINEMRQARENEKTEDEIAEKERRLAYLRQDTTGSNALEIKRLEEEIADQREEYQDALVDQALTNLQEQNAAAAEQRERQIELAQSQLEYNVENGVYVKQVAGLIEDAMEGDHMLTKDDKLYEILHKGEDWSKLSEAGFKDMFKNLSIELNNAFTKLNAGFAQDEDLTRFSNNYMAEMIKRYKENGGKLTKDILELNNLRNDKIEDPNYTGSQKTLTPTELEKILKQNYTNPSSSKTNGSTTNTTNTANATKTYTVKSGDSLSKIAKKELGNMNRWKEIASLNGISSPYIIYPNQKLKLPAYKTGGIADFTGPAWLDGSKTKPELILNARDTENFIILKDVLSGILKNASSIKPSSGDNYFDIDIQVDEIANDYDVDQMAERIKQNIYEDSTYRNVNAVNFLR